MSLPEWKTQPKTLSASAANASRRIAPPSGWLYLAGLCVTLSGLYAVWTNVNSGTYRAATFLLAALGYGFSFMARRLQIPLHSLRTMALSGAGLLFVFALTTRHGLDSLLPAEALADRSKACLILIAWGATLLTFLLTSDAAVLFSCVPSMSMIALVSTLSQDTPMQNVFLVFVAAATFLMVHENYLRTQGGASAAKTETAQKMLRGQMQLAALCVAGSLTLAMLAVIPIRLMGQTLFVPSSISTLRNGMGPLHSLTSPNGGAERSDVLDIATGPVIPGDQPVMEVDAGKETGLYWRGATFDKYTGSSFVNSESLDTRVIEPAWQKSDSAQTGETWTGQEIDALAPPAQFDIYPRPLENTLELPDEAMRNSREITQKITMLNQSSRQIYAAGRVKRVWLPDKQLNHNIAGSLALCATQPKGRVYVVKSRVPDNDPARLRAVSSFPLRVPETIVAHYLPGNKPNDWLEEKAEEITRNCDNNYDRVVAIQNYIARNCKYNLQAPRASRDQDIVEYFLRDSKQGYCDSFAAALTVLCRYAGIPARLATGFCGGEYDARSAAFVVREKDRHAWTEVFFPNVGWVPFDATSGAYDISEYPEKANKKPVNFWTWLLSSGAMPPTLGMACAGILGLALRNEWRARVKNPGSPKARRDPRVIRDRKISASYAAACLALKRRGWERLPAQTPDEYAARIAAAAKAELPEILPPLQILTGLYTASCYGSRAMSEAETTQAKAVAAQIAKILRESKRASGC